MNDKFTPLGIILFGVILWISAQNGSTEVKKVINLFLFVLLVSIILIRWDKVGPIFFRKGGLSNV